MRPKVGSAKIVQKIEHKCWEVAAAAATHAQPYTFYTGTYTCKLHSTRTEFFSRFRVITFFGAASSVGFFVRFGRFVFCANFF